MALLYKLIDLLLYSNAWIALAAVALTAQTQLLLFGSLKWDPLLGFVFFGTLFLYALHRLVGLRRVKAFQDAGRFRIISRYRRHIGWYAAGSALAAGWFLWRCGPACWPWVVLPALVSLMYVLPLFGGRRLRDMHFLKIFLVAGAWAFVTVVLPAAKEAWLWTVPALGMAVERFFFMFAITLPFDIRDLEVDAHTRVKTLPARLGVRRTRWLGGLALGAMLVPVAVQLRLDTYSLGVCYALFLAAALALAGLWYARPGQHDYYYTGLLDGLMILQFALVFALR